VRKVNRKKPLMAKEKTNLKVNSSVNGATTRFRQTSRSLKPLRTYTG
jgi:hypothetical protein